ncbi:TetR family transcriptional regulator [Nocardia goodfellowii]|uniref:AcrR family transcriptional regulator n=1 Tax=Nocardia goodfellowii TaxID=882446 RepID=A0ABS4QJK7_9NOCA|nr:TetR family transcriptional regulator [Nocardia goodfellowii]MBP2191898.1 AcrR family transcriptional regulator [Nocardia goodfellowii]
MVSRPKAASTAQLIIDVVLELLESEGYDAVQLREVARRAHVSLATVYKHFADRDELMVAAVERWMATNSYAGMERPPAHENLADGLMRVLRYVFEPWERNPRMLEAYHRARGTAGGHRLDNQGINAILPVASPLFERADPSYLEDVALVLANMAYALIGRFADGSLEITEILPIFERTVRRLTSDNSAEAGAAASPVTGDGVPGWTVDPALAAPFQPSSEGSPDGRETYGSTSRAEVRADKPAPE